MRRILALFLSAQIICSTLSAQIRVLNLLTENRTNPIGLDKHQPRFSWQLISKERNLIQSAYEIKVTLQGARTPVWSSGKILSDQSVQVPYRGMPLESGGKYNWQVRVWDRAGKVSAWSIPAYWLMGLLNPSDWKAKWIEPGFQEEPGRPSPLFRKEFLSTRKIRSATAYITAHGLYEAQINGLRIGEEYMTPGWTSYNKRLQYQVYDVTNLLRNGNNAIAVTLGNGWYRGIIGFTNNSNVYGRDISLLMQLDITYSDGTTQSVVSDESWRSSTGAIRYSEIYNGETIDAGKEKQGWAMPGYDDKNWSTVKIADHSKAVLVATYNEAVRKHETFSPIHILKTPKGEQVLDFGQNLVGWVVLKVNGRPVIRSRISHAEVLDKEGNFYTENLRQARAEDTYILKGTGIETFEPHFTFHGFRYVKLEGYPGELKPENFTAVTLYSDMKPTGTFYFF